MSGANLPTGFGSTRDQVLNEMISIGTTESPLSSKTKLSAGYAALGKLADLIVQDGSEETFQQFLAEHPQFLMGALGTCDDGDLAYIVKPRMGNKYAADFGLIKFSQGGAGIALIEIEHPRDNLFSAGRTPSKKLAGALGQVVDWSEYLSKYGDSAKRQWIDVAKKLPLYDPAHPSKDGCRFVDASGLDARWNAFGGNDYNFFSYTVIIGRWSNMSPEERKRLIAFNQNPQPAAIMTYDQLARKALVRPDVYEF